MWFFCGINHVSPDRFVVNTPYRYFQHFSAHRRYLNIFFITLSLWFLGSISLVDLNSLPVFLICLPIYKGPDLPVFICLPCFSGATDSVPGFFLSFQALWSQDWPPVLTLIFKNYCQLIQPLAFSILPSPLTPALNTHIDFDHLTLINGLSYWLWEFNFKPLTLIPDFSYWFEHRLLSTPVFPMIVCF